MRGTALFLGMFPPRGQTTVIAPANVLPPVVTGVGYVGYTLTTTNGSWTGVPAPTFTYQWQRNEVDISGATASTYAVTLADEGLRIRCVVTATNSAGNASANSNTIEQWVPTDEGTVAAWYDAYAPATITLATGVSAWANRGSTASVDMVQPTGALQPAYSATGWDGNRPALTFDGIDDFLQNTAPAAIARNAPGVTVAAAVAPTALAVQRRSIWSVSTASDATRHRLMLRWLITTNEWIGGGRRLDGDASISITPGLAASTADRVLTASLDHANDRSRASRDGVNTAWVSPFRGAGNTSNTDAERCTLGAASGAVDSFWDGKIAEVIHYDVTLGDAALAKLQGYLAWRWGVVANLPAPHPWKTAAPTP